MDKANEYPQLEQQLKTNLISVDMTWVASRSSLISQKQGRCRLDICCKYQHRP